MKMDLPKSDPPKLPDMVMCGDHPSITKTELNVKEEKLDVKSEFEKFKEHPMSYARISPTTSRTDKSGELRTRATSEHALRLIEARRRARSMDVVRTGDMVGSGNRVLVQENYSVVCTAALGSFRWPPYLVGIWVLVLLLTHALHCLVAVLESALPNLRKFCLYLRTLTEDSWKSECERRICPLAFAFLTGIMYGVYYALYSLHAIAIWSIEPLCDEDKRDDVETKVTNYADEVPSKTVTSANSKQL